MSLNNKGNVDFVLIHGQGRTPLSMALLGWRLRRYRVHYFGYTCFAQPLEPIVERLIQTLRRKLAGKPYIIVGHSLGGIIARASLPHLAGMLPRHLIMLAPPNQPARLARQMQANPFYRLITGDCGQKLADDSFYERLSLPTIPTTVIAGTGGFNGPRSPFGDEPNDMVLSVNETKLGINASMFLVPATHPFIMNSPEVARIILEIAARSMKLRFYGLE